MTVWDCTEVAIDGVTCVAGRWVSFEPSSWQTLTMEDVAVLASSALTLFAAAWVFRVLRRQV